jgi:hypothetical protein
MYAALQRQRKRAKQSKPPAYRGGSVFQRATESGAKKGEEANNALSRCNGRGVCAHCVKAHQSPGGRICGPINQSRARIKARAHCFACACFFRSNLSGGTNAHHHRKMTKKIMQNVRAAARLGERLRKVGGGGVGATKNVMNKLAYLYQILSCLEPTSQCCGRRLMERVAGGLILGWSRTRDPTNDNTIRHTSGTSS